MSSSTQPCGLGCTLYDTKEKWMTSLWVGLTAFIVFFIFASPVLYRITSFLGTTILCKENKKAAAKRAPSWWGWFLHSLIAGGVAIPIAYGFMELQTRGKKDQCCCPK